MDYLLWLIIEIELSELLYNGVNVDVFNSFLYFLQKVRLYYGIGG